ncbi:efflux RND transporter permease subunit [bacterium]|nr:efflux RND transporter permease subunit [bacterium]
MNISEISIRNPVFAWMLMFGLLVFGGLCFSRMGVSQLPDVDYPVVSVSVGLEGAAPEVMEVDVVDPIEDALMTVQGVTNLTSSSRTGSASITAEFGLDKNIDIAMQEVQSAIAQVVRRLPKEIDAPVVRKSNPEDQPILWLAVSSDKLTSQELMELVRDRIKDMFSTVEGVGEVFLGGYVDPNLRVWLSADKLNQYALTSGDVSDTITQEHAELPSGRIETADKEFNIRTMGEAPTPEEFGKLNISRRGGAVNYRPIKLSDVATIEDGLADIRRRSRTQGKTAVGLGIKKQPGSNAVGVANAAKARMEEIAKTLPEGTEIGVRFDATKFIEEAIHELNFTLILSALLTALVCWVFLGSWSATLNVVMAIPTSVVGAFMALYALGFTLNTFTLLGLSLAIGIVVDDAIMVLENIVRHAEEGKGRREAALIGSREITFAALAATVAIIAIFLPVAFMKGIIGKFFFQFGVTLSIAVALSLLEALTLTPMRCSEFLSMKERTTRFGKFVEWCFETSAHWYGRTIAKLLNFRWLVLLGAFALFGASLTLLKFIDREMVPAQDQSMLTARLQTPVGSSLDFTDKKFALVEEYFMKRPEVDKYFGSVGGGNGEVNSGMLFLTLKEPSQRPKNPKTGRPYTQQELIPLYRQELRSLPDIRVMLQDPSQGGFSAKRGYPVEFTVRGPDFDTLIKSTQKLMESMESSGVVVDVDSSYQAGMPEVQVVPNRDKARERGVSIYEIGQTVNAMMGGVVVGKYSKGGHRYDVRMRLVSGERTRPEDISKLNVRNNRGELIRLSEVVTLQERPSLQAISREQRERAISVFANVAPGHSQAEAIEKVSALAKTELPENYRAVISGSAQTFRESFESLMFALFFGILVSYMVLASQFNSFIHPVTVLMALPFSISGALLSLWLGHQTLNIYSMIGIVLLMGIVKKNSILLVDFTNQVRETGKSVREALQEACPLRLRPILMTSIATIVGAVPPALAIGPGAESRIPMALAVIGGVLVSTALTLFVVPCAYSLFAREKAIAQDRA